MNDSLARLQQWYLSNCNRDWEHTYGVTIGTLDNPGWSLKIELTGTSCDERTLAREAVGHHARGTCAGLLTTSITLLVAH